MAKEIENTVIAVLTEIHNGTEVDDGDYAFELKDYELEGFSLFAE